MHRLKQLYTQKTSLQPIFHLTKPQRHNYSHKIESPHLYTNRSPRHGLTLLFNEAISTAYPKEAQRNNESKSKSVSKIDVSLRSDYQSGNPFSLSKKYKQSVEDAYNNIIQALPNNSLKNALLDKVEFSSPGFINIYIKDKWISDRVYQIANDTINQSHNGEFFTNLLTPSPKQVLIDFASPNMCKELHVGHLRSTVLGDSLSRILSFLGHKVERISHVGDFGTPIGMVLAQAFDTNADFIQKYRSIENLEPSTLTDVPTPAQLTELYVAAKKRGETDKEFSQKAHNMAVQLQQMNKAPLEIRNSWNVLCEASRRGFDEIYRMLDVEVKERGESFYAPFLRDVVQELQKKHLASTSQGAQCVFLHGYKAPFIIEKSDGAHLYTTTDLAAIRYRIQETHKEWIIYVTDDSQKNHFDQLFKIAELAEWLDPSTVRVDHLTFGVVKNSDGKKLSSRDGSPYPLKDLLQEAVQHAKQVANSKEVVINNNNNTTISQDDLARAIAFNAIKYYDLSHSKDYIFSFDEMLSFKGNTAVYLMYAYARLRSIRRKLLGTESDSAPVFANPPIFATPEERSLGLALTQFADVLAQVEQQLAPYVLCEYLYDLAGRFHTFYEKCRIIGDPQQESRIQLCIATEKVLHDGLLLLGLKPTQVL